MVEARMAKRRLKEEKEEKEKKREDDGWATRFFW